MTTDDIRSHVAVDLPAWLTEDPSAILDEIVEARVLGGEDLDERAPGVRDMVLAEARSAQEDILREIATVEDGRIRVWRAVSLATSPDELRASQLAGESWAFGRAGAHPYDGRGTRQTFVVEGLVEPAAISGSATLGFWSSGEGECRLDRRADVEIAGVTTASGHEVARHLIGRSTAGPHEAFPSTALVR